MSIETVLRFAELGLAAPILKAVDEIGYETPSAIQAECIPPMIEGRDVLGQAQTGTGKTAAFALPILSRVDTSRRATQALVLTPTRELAIQVAEAIHTYGRHLEGLHVLPIYGGQHIGAQLRPLQRGVHIVVGTPGRIIDHLDRRTLNLDEIQTVVLDEADEMLRMGFIDDVNRILDQMPETKQVALFSATMPPEVRRIADKHLDNAEIIKIKTKTATVATVEQRYLIAPWKQKLDAMTRILETADFNAMLVFVRTKVLTVELSEKLEARGYSCGPLNGDMTQQLRERTVQRLRDGKLDIVVATDVAARGLDVSRISHVINYDIPNDTESYIHRIGRTGRAGRDGEAIVLVQPREKRMLRTIERATGQEIKPMKLPSVEAVTDRRVTRFKETVKATIESEELAFFGEIVSDYCSENDVTPEHVASALAFLVQQERPLQPTEPAFEQQTFEKSNGSGKGSSKPRRSNDEWTSYRLEVGRRDGVEPKNIVGAITNETGIDGGSIGRITVNHDHCLVDLAPNLPRHIADKLRDIQIFGRSMRTRTDGAPKKAHGYAKGPKRGMGNKPSHGKKGGKRPKFASFGKPSQNKYKKSRSSDG